jgi:hypothetical protein
MPWRLACRLSLPVEQAGGAAGWRAAGTGQIAHLKIARPARFAVGAARTFGVRMMVMHLMARHLVVNTLRQQRRAVNGNGNM